MADYRTMFDKEHIGAWDLNGKDAVVTIEKVVAGKVGRGAQAEKKPILHFVGKTKTMVCNVTNARTIAAMFGNETKAWVGKKIAIYPTVAMFGGKEVDAVRVRPQPPRGASKEGDFDPPDPEVRAEMERRQAEASGRDMDEEERKRRIEAGEDPNA